MKNFLNLIFVRSIHKAVTIAKNIDKTVAINDNSMEFLNAPINCELWIKSLKVLNVILESNVAIGNNSKRK